MNSDSTISRMVNSGLCLALGFVLGCGGGTDEVSRGAVSGEVTLDGEPVRSGTIAFFPSAPTQGPSTSTSIRDGRYFLSEKSGPVIGTQRVEVLAYRGSGKKVTDPRTGELIEETTQVAPPKYNSRSELTATISRGSNTYDLELESK